MMYLPLPDGWLKIMHEDEPAPRPSIDETLMSTAILMSQHGTCSRARVGAVIALDGRIISTGYNGAPAGMLHCAHADDFIPPCVDAVHAEVNAIAFAAKHGLATRGATLYTTHSPCNSCAQLIINAGLVRVVAQQLYRDRRGYDLIGRSTVKLECWRESA
jgi:dCMP deaminase